MGQDEGKSYDIAWNTVKGTPENQVQQSAWEEQGQVMVKVRRGKPIVKQGTQNKNNNDHAWSKKEHEKDATAQLRVTMKHLPHRILAVCATTGAGTSERCHSPVKGHDETPNNMPTTAGVAQEKDATAQWRDTMKHLLIKNTVTTEAITRERCHCPAKGHDETPTYKDKLRKPSMNQQASSQPWKGKASRIPPPIQATNGMEWAYKPNPIRGGNRNAGSRSTSKDQESST